jgi:hypothetical protein
MASSGTITVGVLVKAGQYYKVQVRNIVYTPAASRATVYGTVILMLRKETGPWSPWLF